MSWIRDRFQRLPIRWQFGAVLIATQLIAYVVTWQVYKNLGTGSGIGPVAIALDVVAPFSTIVRLLDQFPDEEETLVAAASSSDPRIGMEDNVPNSADDDLALVAQVFLEAARNAAPPRWRDRIAISQTARTSLFFWNSRQFKLSARLTSGKWITFAPTRDGIWRTLPSLFGAFALLLVAFPLAVVAFWVSSSLISPLGRLAEATKQFSTDIDCPPVAETGPAEVRAAARVFNDMRDRIRTSIESRARTLAAIGHDLRTPLTRMRLRIETLLQDDAVRGRLLIDVRAMETMVNSALSYLRGQQVSYSTNVIDLAALTETVCYDFGDQGHVVVYEGPERLLACCDPDLLRRALTNVIENAVKYAGKTLVTLEPGSVGSRIRISVKDWGPGIPAAERAAVLEPFHRGDAARQNEGQSGFGLGLSIAKDVVERHQGSLTLRENTPSGLIVEIELPAEVHAMRDQNSPDATKTMRTAR
jgi:signal transduction histidine kinase